MIDLKEIEDTIEKIKREGTSVQDAERLSILYGLREHMSKEREPEARQVSISAYSMKSEPESEFRAACVGLSADILIDALEDTIQGLQIVAPKAYAAAIRRLKIVKNE